MKIVETTLIDKLPRVRELLAEHDAEMPFPAPLRLDVDRYGYLERAGLLVCLAAMQGDEIVGYSVGVLCPHPHHADMLILSNDTLFLRKTERKGRAGVDLIRATERAAREHGAGMACFNAEPGTALEALMPRLGYGVRNIIFSKEV